jgi:hypothetical protein
MASRFFPDSSLQGFFGTGNFCDGSQATGSSENLLEPITQGESRSHEFFQKPMADGSDLMGNELAEVKLSGDALAPAGRVQMFGQIH